MQRQEALWFSLLTFKYATNVSYLTLHGHFARTPEESNLQNVFGYVQTVSLSCMATASKPNQSVFIHKHHHRRYSISD